MNTTNKCANPAVQCYYTIICCNEVWLCDVMCGLNHLVTIQLAVADEKRERERDDSKTTIHFMQVATNMITGM